MLENQALREQIESRNENLREMQEYLSQVSKSLEKEKHSHKRWNNKEFPKIVATQPLFKVNNRTPEQNAKSVKSWQ